MAGPSFLALIVQGPRSGERFTVVADQSGDPPEVIELPDRVVVHTREDTRAGNDTPNMARYELTGYDSRRNAYVYAYAYAVS